MLCITTYQTNFPSAVLIRGAYDFNNKIHLNGPGKLTKYLSINKDINNQIVYKKDSKLKFYSNDENNLCGFSSKVIISKRIGVNYAEECKDWLWNFKINDN